eukprot:COSAG02_NODE_16622_length_1070_cov_0.770340_1_plen_57_part_10
MDVTESGITTEVSCAFEENASCAMVVTESGITTEVSPVSENERAEEGGVGKESRTGG